MKSWLIEDVSFEVDELEIRISANSSSAKQALHGDSRVIPVDAITAVSLRPAGAFSGNVKLSISDPYGSSTILIPKAMVAEGSELYRELVRLAPESADKRPDKRVWTYAGVKALDAVAAVRGLSVVEVRNKPTTSAVPKSKVEIKAEVTQKYGKQVYSALIQDGIALRKVSVYQKGFVKIGGRFERLRRASGETSVAKKTGLGRSLATVATFATPWPGFNLLSPGQRGRIALQLFTDRGLHTFSTDQVSESAVRNYEALLSAANGVIELAQASEPAPSGQTESTTHTPSQVPRVIPRAADLASQLKDIAELHAQGILSDEEFRTAKAKLIN